MDIKLLVLKPVNFQKCIENVFKNTFYLTSVILIQWAWGGAQNLYIKKKNDPGGCDFQPSLGTTALIHMWEKPGHWP